MSISDNFKVIKQLQHNSSKSKVVLILATTWNTIKAQANQSGAAAIDKPVADKRIDPTLGYIL